MESIPSLVTVMALLTSMPGWYPGRPPLALNGSAGRPTAAAISSGVARLAAYAPE